MVQRVRLACALSVFFSLPWAAFAQDIPLVVPKKAKPGQASITAYSEEELHAQKPKLGVIVGPKLGGAFPVAGPLGPSLFAAVEIGYRLPVLKRILSLSLEPNFSNPSSARATELGTLKGPTLSVSVPLLVGANVEAGPGLVRVLAGPSFDWAQSDTQVAGFAFSETSTALGVSVSAGYLVHLGPGGLGIELRYHATAPRVAASNSISHLLGVTAAYVFDL